VLCRIYFGVMFRVLIGKNYIVTIYEDKDEDVYLLNPFGIQFLFFVK
jgi:hypothetical protein